MEKILTVPSAEIGEQQTRLMTGNEFVSISGIGLSGGISKLGVVRMDSASLIELEGEPLLSPGITCNGVSQSFVNTSHRYISGWIPEIYMESEQLKVIIRICAPPGYKGFVYIISVVNKTADELALDAELIMKWKNTSSSVFSRKILQGQLRVFENPWTESAVLEFGGSLAIVAFALSGSGGYVINIDSEKHEHVQAIEKGLWRVPPKSFHFLQVSTARPTAPHWYAWI